VHIRSVAVLIVGPGVGAAWGLFLLLLGSKTGPGPFALAAVERAKFDSEQSEKFLARYRLARVKLTRSMAACTVVIGVVVGIVFGLSW
jgi:ABC-type amino acid transport system permease subunit